MSGPGYDAIAAGLAAVYVALRILEEWLKRMWRRRRRRRERSGGR